MKPVDPRLVRRSAAVRRHLVVAVVLGVVGAAALVAQAWSISHVVAARFVDDPIGALALGAALAALLRGAVAWGQTTVAARAASRVKADLRTELVDDLLDPRRTGPRPSSAGAVTLVGQGLDALDAYVGRFLPQVVLAAVVPPSLVLVALVADPLSGVVLAVTVPLIIVFLVLVGLRTQDELGRRWRALERLGRHFADVLDGLVLLTGFGRDTERGLREVGERHRGETVSSLRVAFLSAVTLDLFSTLAVALVAVGIGLRLVHGDLDLATGLFVLLLAPEAFSPVRRLGAHFHDSTAGVEAVDAALEVLDHGRHPGTGPAPDPADGPLVAEHLVVRRPGRERPSLRIDRLEVRPGELVAVTGPSGSGKSTLLSVLLGTELPDEGVVDVAGCDLLRVDPVAWRRHVAWVPQVPGLVDGTVADNVRFGVTATDDQVAAALDAASASDLPLDRWVGEDGRDVSAGERRRLAVARAVLRVRHGGAGLLLLDEPTAGLDDTREAGVLRSVRELGVTTVLVTHHAAAITAADRVVELALPAPATGVVGVEP